MSKTVDNYIKSKGTEEQKRYNLHSVYRFFTTEDLILCMDEINGVLLERRVPPKFIKDELTDGWHQFSNFMAGVSQALGCRLALRIDNGHKPIGTTIASGEMWTIDEIVHAHDRVRYPSPFKLGALSWIRAQI